MDIEFPKVHAPALVKPNHLGTWSSRIWRQPVSLKQTIKYMNPEIRFHVKFRRNQERLCYTTTMQSSCRNAQIQVTSFTAKTQRVPALNPALVPRPHPKPLIRPNLTPPVRARPRLRLGLWSQLFPQLRARTWSSLHSQRNRDLEALHFYSEGISRNKEDSSRDILGYKAIEIYIYIYMYKEMLDLGFCCWWNQVRLNRSHRILYPKGGCNCTLHFKLQDLRMHIDTTTRVLG